MTVTTVILDSKIQIIYFKTSKNLLSQTYATSDKRITLTEAENILKERSIDFDEILKVQYESIKLELPLHDIQDFIK